MAGTSNDFISWSGERSNTLAAALYDWLPMVVKTPEPWMSEEDIEKGSRGLDDIGKALAAMGVGTICLTPENLEKPWILFEAGALATAPGDKARVCPYLFGDLRPENVKPPPGKGGTPPLPNKYPRIEIFGERNIPLRTTLAERFQSHESCAAQELACDVVTTSAPPFHVCHLAK